MMLAKGDIKNIVDHRLQGELDINSVWKAIEVAISCVSSLSSKRPSMNEVVIELKTCLEMELARKRGHQENDSISNEIDGFMSVNLPSESGPLAR